MGARHSGSGRLTARLLRCGVAAGPVFIATFLVAGATRADYDPLRHPVSLLALGPDGWVQVANFLIAGVLSGAAAVGLARGPVAARTRVGPILVGAAGLGLLGSGAFLTDPISGYPPGTPDLLTSHSSTEALLHDLAAIPVFLGLPAAALAYAWAFRRAGDRGWAAGSAAAGLAMLVGLVLTSAALAQTPTLVAFGGLLQRLTITTGLGWLTAVSARALATTAAPTPAAGT
ncbi:DUF998 domain-containing protein [Pseudonocardia humida]|uniref:DUF998 domain-containing protein n=1 Tax=Pseudonocardia humida TaxID=2800819 RepID=A0ABT1A2F7_9PSEU|nr:DUF998 domain-containing protein [Pseudonocardia humida]MCO1657141.1 DUF998 domain-containing protein [Pseudonocardia humida]